MSILWDIGTPIAGAGEIELVGRHVRVDLDTIPPYLSLSGSEPPLYRNLGTIGAAAGDRRYAPNLLQWPQQELEPLPGTSDTVWYRLVAGVSGTLYRGVTVSNQSVACRVHSSIAITLTSGVALAIPFNATRRDDFGLHSSSVNPTRITVAEPGWYILGGSARFAAHAAGVRSLEVVVNGATAVVDVEHQAVSDSGEPTKLACSTVYYLSKGDYVELWATQTSGGNLDITVAGHYSPEFFAALVN